MADKDIQAEFDIIEPELNQPKFSVVETNGVSKVEILGFDDPEITPAQLGGREVSVRKAIILGNGRINTNELTAFVQNKVASVKALDVATADEKDIKKAQATLNKTAEELSDVRIAMQKVWAEPFEQNIALPIKKLVTFINEQKKPISDKLVEISVALQNAQAKIIGEAKAERLAKEPEEVDRYIASLSWFDDAKWLNKGSTEKKITAEVDAKVTQIAADLKAIGMLNADNPFGPQLMETYRNNGGNLAQTLLKRQELEEAARQYAKMQADLAAKKEAERIEREKVEAEAKAKRESFAQGGTVVIGAVPPPKFMQNDKPEIFVEITPDVAVDLPPVEPVPLEEKLYITTFEVKANRGDLARVIEFMKQIGVRSRFVDSKEA